MPKLNPNTQSLVEFFYHWEKTTPDQVYLRQPYGDTWKEITFAEAGQEARKITTALRSYGLKKGDHVGLISKNCYHWILADLAIMMGGFVSVPYYPSLPKDQLKVLVEMSDLKAFFIGKVDDWGTKGEVIPDDVKIISFPHYEGNAEVNEGDKWEDLIATHEPAVDNYIPDGQDLWTIVFTSGTTGTPKGVMHIHKTPVDIMVNEEKTNWLGYANIDGLRTLSYLPLNHVAERVGLESGCLGFGGSMSFAESLDTFAKNLQDTQPTFFFGVPRIWTKLYLGILSKIPLETLNVMLETPGTAEEIKKQLKYAIGMSNVQIAGAGAAITPAFLKEFYKKLDIQLIEAYGMTEVCGSMTNSPAPDAPVDSVGQAIPSGEVRIDPETGEIQMKSPYMMKGYYKNPEKTAEVLKDGWLHSGDRGTIDENGYVRVIGRLKDAFKTSKGIYITPNPMEEKLLKNDYIEQVCVVGLGVPQPLAIINLSELATQADKAVVQESLMASLAECNEGVSNYQIISHVVVDGKTWTTENEMLTPTLKVRRWKIDEDYRSNYPDWYDKEEKIIWL